MISLAPMPKPAEPLDAYIRRIRKEKGLSLNDVARNSRGQVSNAYVSQLENGHVLKPSVKKLGALARGIGVPESELLARAGGRVQENSDEFQQALLDMLQEEWNLATPKNREFIDGIIQMVIDQSRVRRKAG